MTRQLALSLVLAAAVLGCKPASHSHGSWQLVPAESTIKFVGTKNGNVGVPGTFASLEGEVDGASHTAFVEVKLASTTTGDPARDENIRAHLFEAAKFPLARFELAKLPEVGGKEARTEVSGVLALHGGSVPLTVPVHVEKLESPERLRVRTTSPVVLTAAGLGMQAQFATLKAVCGHQSLSDDVPVEVDLIFARASD